jgi:hypothetical protein
MPEALMAGSMILPLILAMIIKQVDFRYVITSWVVSLFMVLFCMIYFGLTQSLGVFICFLPLSFIGLCENQRQILSIYYLTQAQQHLLAENTKVAAENHTTEMRHMIGNVAHDLKTVSFFLLSFFVFAFLIIFTAFDSLPQRCGAYIHCSLRVGQPRRQSAFLRVFFLLAVLLLLAQQQEGRRRARENLNDAGLYRQHEERERIYAHVHQ